MNVNVIEDKVNILCEVKTMTNFEHIKQMSVEEMANKIEIDKAIDDLFEKEIILKDNNKIENKDESDADVKEDDEAEDTDDRKISRHLIDTSKINSSDDEERTE